MWGTDVHARDDIANYQQAAADLVNYRVRAQGGIQSRAGWRLLAEVKDSTAVARLLRFAFNVEQAYGIEAGPLYFRFYTTAGRLESGGSPVEVVTPYTAAQVFDLHFTQSADVLYLAHPSHAPRELRRTSATSFSLALYDYQHGPFQDFNSDTTKTLTASATTGTGITVTATGHTPFTANHVGSIWAIGTAVGTPAVQGYVKVTGFTSGTQVTADVIQTLSGTTATDRWAPPAWSDETGWPRTVEFQDFRLVWSGAGATPQHFQASKTGDFTNHALLDNGVVTADSAVVRELAARGVNAIRGLVGADVLLATTADAVWRIDGNQEDTITPTNIRARRVARKGASTVQPLLVGETAVYLHRGGTRIFGIEFDLEQDARVPRELTAFNREIAGTGIVQLEFEDGEIPTLWAVRSDGQLGALTYDLTQKVFAWSRQTTDGAVESVTTLPRTSDEQDVLFVLVKRTIGGVTKRYVEMADDTLWFDSAIDGTFGFPVTTVSGLAHLEGKSVGVVVDGAWQGLRTVSGGQVTGLSPAGTSVQVGLPFTPTAQLLPPAFPTGENNPSKPRVMQTAELVLDVVATYGLAVNGVQIETKKASDPMDAPPPLITGLIRVTREVKGTAATVVSQPLPYPSHIRAIHRYVEVEDD